MHLVWMTSLAVAWAAEPCEPIVPSRAVAAFATARTDARPDKLVAPWIERIEANPECLAPLDPETLHHLYASAAAAVLTPAQHSPDPDRAKQLVDLGTGLLEQALRFSPSASAPIGASSLFVDQWGLAKERVGALSTFRLEARTALTVDGVALAPGASAVLTQGWHVVQTATRRGLTSKVVRPAPDENVRVRSRAKPLEVGLSVAGGTLIAGGAAMLASSYWVTADRDNLFGRDDATYVSTTLGLLAAGGGGHRRRGGRAHRVRRVRAARGCRTEDHLRPEVSTRGRNR